jgi:hypothetical protein
MPTLTLISPKFPGINLTVPQIPGTKPPVPGAYHFSVGIPIEVSDETAQAVKDYFDGFEVSDPGFAAHWKIQVNDSTAASTATKNAVDAPLPPPQIQPDGSTESTATKNAGDTPPPPPQALPIFEELTVEDQELILIEVSKLEDKTNAEAGAIIESTANNLDLDIALRVVYLQEILKEVESGQLKKGLRENTEKLLKEIV